MPEFQVIKRGDVPNAWQIGTRMPDAPKVRLHRAGCLFFSTLATEALGDRDCNVLCEYDEAQRTLKFTVVAGKLPPGVSQDDTFPLRIRRHQHGKRPIGMLSCRALLNFVGFLKIDKPQDFPIRSIDAKGRSITLELPSNNGVSH